ncbi:hypothetical protein ACIREO_33505 [Streptomyces sp. NPDC102441]|uniref:hypothetical protein n=1 Tax=Streptomyces sp. NPDC102441 TaxID=3366176 RepID=UPI0038273410
MAMVRVEEQATRNGIMSLEQAFTGVQRCQQDVQSKSDTIANSYGGEDGKAYNGLMRKWDEQVSTILVSLDRMIDELNTSLTEQGKTQGSSSEAINTAYSRSSSVFDELQGLNSGPSGVAGGTNPTA